jgi:hypothetical protein
VPPAVGARENSHVRAAGVILLIRDASAGTKQTRLASKAEFQLSLLSALTRVDGFRIAAPLVPSVQGPR